MPACPAFRPVPGWQCWHTQGVPSLCTSASHPPLGERSHNVISEYLWGKPFLSTHHWHSLSFSPFTHHLHQPSKGCRKCQGRIFSSQGTSGTAHLPRNLVSIFAWSCAITQFHKLSQAALPILSPPPSTWLQSGEGAAANTGNKSGFQPSFLLVEKEELQLYICIYTYTHLLSPNISFSLHFPLNTLYWGWKKI